MNSLIRTLAYHNGVPIALGLFFLLAATTFAASDGTLLPSKASDASEATTTDSSVPIGTDALLDADIADFDTRMRVTAVSEQVSSYEVSYTYRTLAIEDGSWRELERTGVLSVPKDQLSGMPLEAYVREQLREVAERERAFLVRAQTLELAIRSRAEQASNSNAASAFGSLTGLIDLTDAFLPPAPGVRVAEPQEIHPAEELPVKEAEAPVPDTAIAAPDIATPISSATSTVLKDAVVAPVSDEQDDSVTEQSAEVEVPVTN